MTHPSNTYDPASYGDGCAAFYDRIYPNVDRAMLATLQRLAGDGPVLELGIAAGRVAIPLAVRGVRVSGIEASPAMRARFVDSAHAHRVELIAGDFVHDCLRQRYRLVFALVGTLSLLPSRDLQQACLENVAAHLLDDGVFIHEGFAEADDAASADPQQHSHRLQFGAEQHDYTVTTLSTPAERLDALAAEAGLALTARWSDWRGTPYRADALRHISFYRRDAAYSRRDDARQVCEHRTQPAV